MEDHQPLPSPLTLPTPTLRCPRCDSPNTKFCYYNNYNLSQPRHFCKSCRRYWTKGGALRNVPVGGASRKPKRPSPLSSKPSRPPKSRKVHPDNSAEDDDRRSGSETSNLTTVTADGNLTWALSGDENACVFADLWVDRQLPLMDHPTDVDFPPIPRADWPGLELSDVMGGANVDLLAWNEGQCWEGEPSFLFLP